MLNDTIFVDESGNAGLKNKSHNSKHPYFIIGFTFCKEPLKLKNALYDLLNNLHKDKKYAQKLKELKFYPYRALQKLGYSQSEIEQEWQPHFNQVRQETVSVIAKYSDGIFAGILNKQTVLRDSWTPETIGNYLFNQSLFYKILPQIKFNSAPEILFDKGRLSHDQTQEFNEYMLNTDSYLENVGIKRYSGSIITIKDVNSVYNSGIWSSDFVAGSFHHSLMKRDSSFLSVLKPKFIGKGSLNLWF